MLHRRDQHRVKKRHGQPQRYRTEVVAALQVAWEATDRVYIVDCGTCATMTRMGREEVLNMKEHLQELGKLVTSWTIIPTACNEMTEIAIRENDGANQNATCILVMACALGVHRVSPYTSKLVIPALDTLSIGIEEVVPDILAIAGL